VTLPGRPWQFGGTYGEREVPEIGYYGPTNPGHELAQAVLGARAAKRQDEEAASLEKERQAMAAWRQAQADRESRMDPLNEAVARARLRGMGVRMPGEMPEGPAMRTDTQGGLPPAGQFGAHGGGGLAGTAQDPSMQRPTLGGGSPGLAGTTQDPRLAGTAHTLPGAFNPVTGAHNPADIDLGGGYSMPYSATPEARQALSAQQLMESGIPNMTPGLALYLSEHPEHVGPMLAQAHSRSSNDPYGPESTAFHEHMRVFDAEHPLRDQPEISLAGALQEVDRLYGKGMPGGAAETLGADRRMELAQQMTRRGFPAARMPLSGIGDRNARFQARTGRTLPTPSPEEQTQDTQGAARARQLGAIRSMIPKGADPTRVREILRQHGVTDEEAAGILNPPAAPKAPRAPGAGSRF